MAISFKSQIAQGSTQIGLVVAAVGNALPYITPDFLKSIGLPQPWVHGISSAIAIALIIYQPKPAAPAAAPPAAPTDPKQSGRVTLAMLAMLTLTAALIGCSYMSQLIAPAAQPFVLAAVDVAVAQAITNQAGGDATAQKAVALKIKTVAKQILAADSSVNTTVATLEIDLNAKILALKLPPPELAASLALAASLEAALTTYIQTTPKGQVVSTTQIAIADIANAVITAAGAYGV